MEYDLESIDRIERVLDSSIPLLGGYRIGIDGIIGLIPGVGDVITGSISTFIVYKAIKMNIPKFIIFKMIINIGIDTVLGSIPIVGDLFDFAWKSNVKNAQLIRQHIEKKSGHFHKEFNNRP